MRATLLRGRMIHETKRRMPLHAAQVSQCLVLVDRLRLIKWFYFPNNNSVRVALTAVHYLVVLIYCVCVCPSLSQAAAPKNAGRHSLRCDIYTSITMETVTRDEWLDILLVYCQGEQLTLSNRPLAVGVVLTSTFWYPPSWCSCEQ